jgi:hypothetical protein
MSNPFEPNLASSNIEKIKESPASENGPEQSAEKEKLEQIPTSEEVQLLFEKILGKVKYETTRKLEDEQGLYLWEIKILQEDGTSIEYEYYKSKNFAEGSAFKTAIRITYFDEDGIPISGTTVAKFIDNKWVETP